MQTKTLSERIEELNKIKKSYEFEPTNNEFFKAMKVIEELQEENETLQELNAISYDANARLSKENEALLAKNKELEAQNKSWQEMVESTNQTNQALVTRVTSLCELFGEEKDELLAKNKELEEELQERKAYIDAWAKKTKELEEKLKNNLEETKEKPTTKKNLQVERTLEELKLKLKNDFWCESQYHYELLDSITNLIDALEAEKNQKKLGLNAIFPNAEYVYSESNLDIPEPTITFQTPDQPELGFNSPTWSDVSKPEPKIKTGTITASDVSKAWEDFDKKIEAAFVNQIEDMEARLRKLEGK